MFSVHIICSFHTVSIVVLDINIVYVVNIGLGDLAIMPVYSKPLDE